MTTTPRLQKSLTQVNTSDARVPGSGGSSYQGNGQIAGLQDGGYVVVWEDDSRTHNPDGYAVAGQRYDSAGNKVGGEVKLSGLSSGHQFEPAVTVLPNGNIAVAFVDYAGGDSDIKVRIFDSSLNIVRQDNIDTGVNQTYNPSLTAFAAGSYVVSYTLENSATDSDIVARRVSATGAVGGQLDIHNATDISRSSELAGLSNGNFAAVYENWESGGTPDIGYDIFTPAGTRVAGDLVPGAGGSGDESDPDVAALRDGGFVVAWTDSDSTVYDIRASILSNTGQIVASNILVNTTTTGWQEDASVAAMADGGFLVTWIDNEANLIRAQRFDAAGGKIGAEFTVSAEYFGAEVDVLSDGRIAFAAPDFSPSTGDFDVTTSIWTTGWNPAATGDFNGDGTDDILWRDAVGNNSEWLMSPAGGIAGNPSLLATPGWSVVASGDFNGDGTDDILWKHDATGATSEWLMGNGGLSSNPVTPGAAGWNLVASGDFNGDGTDDLMWQHASSGVTSEWLMSPTGGVGSFPATPSAAGWNLIASGDFNGDGTDDLMWQHASSGVTSEWLMSPTGGVGSFPATPSAAGWNLIASGDFNGDGTDDLMWQHASSGVTSEWLMSPTGGVGSFPATPSAAGWNLVASGDFNGDGTDDFMWQNAASGATSEWLMDDGFLSSNPGTPPATGWDVVASDDFNGDGTIDLMWQNALSGATSEWLMSPGGGVGGYPFTPLM